MGLADEYEKIRDKQIENSAGPYYGSFYNKYDYENEDTSYLGNTNKLEEERRRQEEEKRREDEKRRKEAEIRNRKIVYGILLGIVTVVFLITFIVGDLRYFADSNGFYTVFVIISFIAGWVSAICFIIHCPAEETKSWVAVVSWILAIVALIMVIVLICS